MKTPYPIVTAVVPSYNHELWVQDALFSLVKQNYSMLRIVFIDDGSTDKTWAKAQEICQNLKNHVVTETEPVELLSGTIEYIPIILARLSKNYGPSTSRNYGIRTGWNDTDLYAFLDSDDVYLEGKIHKSIEPFVKYGDNLIGIVYSDYITENVQTGLLCREFKPTYSREHLLRECIINMDSIVSKKAFEKSGLFEPSIRVCEDYDNHLRLTERSIAVHVPEPLVKIRVGKHSSTNAISKLEWEKNYATVMQRLKNRLENN